MNATGIGRVAVMVNDVEEAEKSLVRLKKASRVISVVSRILLCIFCIGWAILTCIFAVLFFAPEIIPEAQPIGIGPLLLCFLFGLLVVASLRIAMLIFGDVAKGESPFTKRQVRRIRLVAIIFLVYVVAEMIFPTSAVPVVQGEALQVGYHVSAASSDVPVLNVNFGMLSAAVIFYCLSLVFEYGTLLQRLSDETL